VIQITPSRARRPSRGRRSGDLSEIAKEKKVLELIRDGRIGNAIAGRRGGEREYTKELNHRRRQLPAREVAMPPAARDRSQVGPARRLSSSG
jgi:hypothetical protein